MISFAFRSIFVGGLVSQCLIEGEEEEDGEGGEPGRASSAALVARVRLGDTINGRAYLRTDARN